MLKKILIVFAILIASLISFFILINIFYPLDKNEKIEYKPQTIENQNNGDDVNKDAPVKEYELINNKKFNYQFSVEKSMLCSYYDESLTAMLCTFGQKTQKQREDVFVIMITVSENDQANLEQAVDKIINDPQYQNNYIKLKNKPITTNTTIAKQEAKKIIVEPIINNVDEWYIENDVLKYNSNIYNIQYFSETGSKKHLNIFYDILDSFQFTK